MFADDVGQLDEGRVERFDVALGEVFEKAAESYEMVSLGDSLEILAVAVFFAIELETEFAQEFLGNVGGLKLVAFAGDVTRD